jgi:hypothetical protein
MTQSISKHLRIELARTFVEKVAASNANVYVAFSKVQPWANDAIPDQATDTREYEVTSWRSLVGGKKLTGNDFSLVVPRVNWTANSTYAQFSDTDAALFANNKNFYVLTDEFNVYKCLDNNNSANSTIKPTYTSYDKTNKEVDGYVWKYMLTLSTAARNKFLTNDWMPVNTLNLNDGTLQWLVQQRAIDGGLDIIRVTAAGNNYNNAANISIVITGDGSGALATANVNTTTNTVTFITMSTPGSGYRFANVVIRNSSGSGDNTAKAVAVAGPQGGHGSNPEFELGASNLMINTRLRGTEGGPLLANNDYRQLVLINDPLTYGSAVPYANSTFNQTTTVLVSAGIGAYLADEYVFQGGTLATSTFSGRVVEWNATTNKAYLTEVAGTPTSALLQGANSATARFVITTTPPALVPYSGKVLYIENTTPIVRSVDQTEDIKFVLKF